MDNKKSYYAIIPAFVRYDKRLSPNCKLLYGEITALCNEKGYCWASNNYFAKLYKVSKQSISSWVKQLKENGYINTEIILKEGSKEILHRYIRIFEHPMQENLNTPIQENLKDNNTGINITLFNNQSINQQEIIDTIEQYRNIIYENIDYYIIIETLDKELVDDLVEIMLETICSRAETIRIAKQDISFSVVKQRMLTINSEHIEYVINCFKNNTTKVHNIKNYLLTSLYNAPLTMDSYYTALVNHDLYGNII